MSHQNVPANEKTAHQGFPEEHVMATSASSGVPVPHKRHLCMSVNVAYYKCSENDKSVRVTKNALGEIKEEPHMTS